MKRGYFNKIFFNSISFMGLGVLLFISCEINDKISPKEQSTFIKYLGSNLKQSGYDLVQNSSNSLVLLGVAEKTDANANRDIYVLVTDANGNVINDPNIESKIQEDESLTDADNHSPVMVESKNKDGYYLAFERTISNTASSLIVIKFDNNFNKIWYVDTQMPEGQKYTPNDIISTSASENGVLIFGTTTLSVPTGENPDSTITIQPSLNEQVFLIKLDENGDQQWRFFYGSDGFDRAIKVFEDPNTLSYNFAYNTINGLRFIGALFSQNGSPSKEGVIEMPNFNVVDVFLFDKAYYMLGNYTNSNQFGIISMVLNSDDGITFKKNNDLELDVVEVSNAAKSSSIFVKSLNSKIMIFVAGTKLNGSIGQSDYYLSRFTYPTDAALAYEKGYGTTGPDEANKVIVNENNEIFLLGYMTLSNTVTMGLIKLDSLGNFNN